MKVDGEDRLAGGALRVCHRCGAPIPAGLVAYCSTNCRSEARTLALAGVEWKPAPEFAAALKSSKIRERSLS